MLTVGDKIAQLAGILLVLFFVVYFVQWLFKLVLKRPSSQKWKWNEVRPGVRTFALWSLGLLFCICAVLIIAENWQVVLAATLGFVIYAGYYVAIVTGCLVALFFLVRFVKWSWFRD